MYEKRPYRPQHMYEQSIMYKAFQKTHNGLPENTKSDIIKIQGFGQPFGFGSVAWSPQGMTAVGCPWPVFRLPDRTKRSLR